MPFDGHQFSQLEPYSSPPESQPSGPFSRALAAVGSMCRAGWQRARMRLPTQTPAVGVPEIPVAETLRLARSLIESEDHWITRRYSAVGGRYCAVGALRLVGRLHGKRAMTRAHQLLREVASSRGFSSVEGMNDVSSHHEVLSAFDAAIATATVRDLGRSSYPISRLA